MWILDVGIGFLAPWLVNVFPELWSSGEQVFCVWHVPIRIYLVCLRLLRHGQHFINQKLPTPRVIHVSISICADCIFIVNAELRTVWQLHLSQRAEQPWWVPNLNLRLCKCVFCTVNAKLCSIGVFIVSDGFLEPRFNTVFQKLCTNRLRDVILWYQPFGLWCVFLRLRLAWLININKECVSFWQQDVNFRCDTRWSIVSRGLCSLRLIVLSQKLWSPGLVDLRLRLLVPWINALFAEFWGNGISILRVWLLSLWLIFVDLRRVYSGKRNVDKEFCKKRECTLCVRLITFRIVTVRIRLRSSWLCLVAEVVRSLWLVVLGLGHGSLWFVCFRV